MNEKAITKVSLITNTILFMIAGIIIICFNTDYINLFHITTSIIITTIGTISLILNIIKTKKTKDILLSISTTIIGIFFYNNKKHLLSLFPIIFGLYMLLNGLIKLSVKDV